MGGKKIDILQPLVQRLLQGKQDYHDCVVFGFPEGYGGRSTAVAVTIAYCEDAESLSQALSVLPYGFTVIGFCEQDESDVDSRLLNVLDTFEDLYLFRIRNEELSVHCGLDFLDRMHQSVITSSTFWRDIVCTFRLQGRLLFTTVLEKPELDRRYAEAKRRIEQQATFSFPKSTFLLPGCPLNTSKLKNADSFMQEAPKSLYQNQVYFCNDIAFMEVQVFYDHSKESSLESAPVIVSESSPRSKYFEHFLNIDTLVVLPKVTPVQDLRKMFVAAVLRQLEEGYMGSINEQLNMSTLAEKPETFHFWLPFAHHFISAVYPSNVPDEKLQNFRATLHKIFYCRETRPYFRRSASLFQHHISLVSPHHGMIGKYSVTEVIRGNLEYKHYMQDHFNDDGWGCAYRSLQSIISWFRMQGFTALKIPSHKEIQECLVSLGDKQQNFIGSRQWIGSTEVGFVLEALLGVTCRIISVSSGSEIASRASELESHFRTHGTPVMIGGGVLAHTIIGISRDPDDEEAVQYLILDPHYTGKDEYAAVQPGKSSWVSWKDNKFWNKTSFYNMCLPLLPTLI